MKNYRLTKITVKTREIISLSNNAADEKMIQICPQCHSPLKAMPPAENVKAEIIVETRSPELLPAVFPIHDK